MRAPHFGYGRMVDLSRPLAPLEHPWVGYQPRIESIARDGQGWYVVSQLGLAGHAGTHVEAPLHAVEGGTDVGGLPVEAFFGETAVLDFSAAPMATPIAVAAMQEAGARAGGVRQGDIVFFRFDWDRRPGGLYPPYPSNEALAWLVDQGIKLLGIDSPGLEVEGDRRLPNHRLLFGRGIPLIESLVNLELLRSGRVWVFAQPLPAQGADAVPLRVLAFEGE
ncbi:MAG: cyclase family protein [Candidatus Handelsmanbacteria bacterium]|nr:cyclase family protein [Candidatus Handelsmanbacteria bacterium]